MLCWSDSRNYFTQTVSIHQDAIWWNEMKDLLKVIFFSKLGIPDKHWQFMSCKTLAIKKKC